VIATAERESDVWATVGIHPHEADAHADLGEGRCWSPRHPRVIGLGETGLDYYYDHSTARRSRLFRTHIRVGAKPACR
jgi:TatD DNase family protein